jgi:hypothetical protein
VHLTANSIYTRIDCALEKGRWRKLALRGIYLDAADYAEFVAAETKAWRESTGSKATVYPLSYGDHLIIGGAAVPVKEAGTSAVYATSGEGITIPKRLSPRVKAAA